MPTESKLWVGSATRPTKPSRGLRDESIEKAAAAERRSGHARIGKKEAVATREAGGQQLQLIEESAIVETNAEPVFVEEEHWKESRHGNKNGPPCGVAPVDSRALQGLVDLPESRRTQAEFPDDKEATINY